MIMFEVPLNNSPDLSMEEITKLLFNNEFMSDIQFHVEQQVIYAHSWEIMKRSVVFRQQFQTNLGENKLIPIDDVKYDALYQFLRFIYTDEIDIEEDLMSDVLKLAVRYKIVKLETKVLNMVYETNDTDLKLLEFGVLNNYELCKNHVLNNIHRDLNIDDLKGSAFLTIHPNTFEEILNYNIGLQHLSEVDLFNGLVQWMNALCEKNNISLTERRDRFDKLIRLIRFPAMSADDFRLCIQNYPDLLTNADLGAIIRPSLISLIDENYVWNTKPRLPYQIPINLQKHTYETKWITKFTVLDDLILRGIRLGECEYKRISHKLRISSRNRTTNIIDIIDLKSSSNLTIKKISFGDSIKLFPSFEYTIETIFLQPFDEKKDENEIFIYCRDPSINAIVTGPSKLVELVEVSKNLIEIIFKLPFE